MTMPGNRPLVGVISDRRMQGAHPFHMVGEKYLQAVADGADAYPVALPSLAEGFDVLDILDRTVPEETLRAGGLRIMTTIDTWRPWQELPPWLSDDRMS